MARRRTRRLRIPRRTRRLRIPRRRARLRDPRLRARLRDLRLREAPQRHEGGQRRQGECRGEIEHGALGDVLPARAHQCGAEPVADRGIARIATEAQRHAETPGEQEAHGGDGRAERAARNAVQDFGEIDEQRNRMDREHQGAGREDQYAERGDPGLVRNGVDQRTCRHLTRHRAHGTDGQRHPDGGLRPALAAQIDGDEGAEAGLDVGNEQINQSRPRAAAASTGWELADWLPPVAGIGSLRCAGGVCSIGARCIRRRHEHSRAVRILVLRSRLQFLPAHIQDDGLVARGGIEAQQWPVDRDAPGAHAEESAEIDDGDSHPSVGIREHIDHAAEILSFGTLYVLAQNRHERGADLSDIRIDDPARRGLRGRAGRLAGAFGSLRGLWRLRLCRACGLWIGGVGAQPQAGSVGGASVRGASVRGASVGGASTGGASIGGAGVCASVRGAEESRSAAVSTAAGSDGACASERCGSAADGSAATSVLLHADRPPERHQCQQLGAPRHPRPGAHPSAHCICSVSTRRCRPYIRL